MDIEQIYPGAFSEWESIIEYLEEYQNKTIIRSTFNKKYGCSCYVGTKSVAEKKKYFKCFQEFYSQFGMIAVDREKKKFGKEVWFLYFDEEDMKKLITYCKLR